jgi:hypothetical protein
MRVLVLLFLLLAAGCTHFEYDLTQPPDLAQHIGTKDDVVAKMDPLEYRFRSYEDHLVIRIFNPTSDPIHLLGDKSAAVDPNGESHRLCGATIESHSFVKLILPPAPRYMDAYASSDRADDDQPIYLMTSGGHCHTHAHFHNSVFVGGWGWGYYDPWYWDYWGPRYYVLYDSGDSGYWTWKGETEARLALSFERNGETFRDEFAFRRMQVKG